MDAVPVSTSLRFQCLNAVEIFADLTAAELKAFSEVAPVKEIRARELLYSPHQSAEVIFMLSAGRVKLYHLTPDGNMLHRGFIQPGAMFGEMNVIGQTMLGCYVEAVEDSLICVMYQADVERLLLNDVRILRRIVNSIGQRLIDTEYQLYIMALKTALERVAAALLYMGLRYDQRTPGQETLRVDITHDDLAAIIGTNRETVTRTLNEMQREGTVKLGRGRVLLHDLRRLRELSGQ